MRGVSKLLFLILLISSVVQSKKYYFTFYVDLICRVPNRATFAYNAQFFDRDVVILNDDDSIGKPHISRSPIGNAEFRVTGMLTGDELWSDFFNVKMVLYHNCNRENEEVKLDINLLPLFEISKLSDDKYYQYHLTRDITELSGEVNHNRNLVQN
ncbi:Protein CBG21787 [Caenorhabditis briggsae]|uniref:Protein CBG21787 n=1 Tax=Caenorhabditis briggsae TaxID=6238 RepID=A8Y0H5_CAEBR|nr:Protein CBG21787 [Caenorhabditis briggsae]CAP38393.1 Protein CBG21787 [Caenorhabditis briggsae]